MVRLQRESSLKREIAQKNSQKIGKTNCNQIAPSYHRRVLNWMLFASTLEQNLPFTRTLHLGSICNYAVYCHCFWKESNSATQFGSPITTNGGFQVTTKNFFKISQILEYLPFLNELVLAPSGLGRDCLDLWNNKPPNFEAFGPIAHCLYLHKVYK